MGAAEAPRVRLGDLELWSSPAAEDDESGVVSEEASSEGCDAHNVHGSRRRALRHDGGARDIECEEEEEVERSRGGSGGDPKDRFIRRQQLYIQNLNKEMAEIKRCLEKRIRAYDNRAKLRLAQMKDREQELLGELARLRRKRLGSHRAGGQRGAAASPPARRRAGGSRGHASA